MTISYHQRSAALTDEKGRNRPFSRIPDTPQPRRKLKIALFVALGCVALVVIVFAGLIFAGGWIASAQPAPKASELGGKPAPTDPQKLKKANETLAQKLSTLAPKEQYAVIDTALNRIYWREGESTLREMIASCGSGNVLEDPATGRKWTFDTPRGEHRIQVKKTDPVWIKPDWAFIEEGEAIPKDGSGRSEPGMMGDYALGIGRGYFIHGTLYKRLLGRNVSHGCVRLGDEDLEFFYKTAQIGTRVIIF